jgi:AcrR family transcriptional regulator
MPPVTDTRQRLIDAAGELFWERGYAATGLSDILAAAGARGGSLYHFFPTKDDLLLAVIDHQAALVETSIENALAAEQEPRAKVLAMVELYRRYMQRTACTLGCPLTNLTGEVGDSHPAAAVKLAAFSDRIVARLAEHLAGALAQADARRIARSVLCMVQGALLQARASHRPEALDECAATADSILQQALGAPQTLQVHTRPWSPDAISPVPPSAVAKA